MKKIIFIIMVVFVSVLFVGCANKVPEYAPSTDNIVLLKSFTKDNKGIDVINFTDSGRNESKVMCRLAYPVGIANGKTFASYIEDAFKKELVIAGLYNPKSNIKISANIDKVYGSTMLGNAYWEFTVTLKSSNGTKYTVKSKYSYESSFTAYSACSEMQRSFVPAVQKLIQDIVKNPRFKDLIK